MPVVAILGFFAVTYLLNVMVHCNFEVPPTWLVRSSLGRVVGSTSFHAMHHARAVGGQGLARLTERIDAADGLRPAP